MSIEDQRSYTRILKSSGMLGGSQFINLLIGFVRVKFAALLIGAVGVGLISAYQSLIELLGGAFGLGLKSSAVRDVAVAASSGDTIQLARSVLSLRRISCILGGLGLSFIVIFSHYISEITFGDQEHAFDVSLIGLAVLFANLQGAEIAVIQGLRRIGDLAKIQIISGFIGAMISILLYYEMGVSSAAYAVVLVSIVQFVVSRWYSRQITLVSIILTWADTLSVAGGMIRLGLAFMWGGLLTTGVAYVTRVLIVRELDLVSVGIFSAAYALSGMLVNFVLSAMAGDYYPSLTAVASDHLKMRNLVNQQTEIGLLLALPGVLGTLAFSPILINFFYTSEFWQSEIMLRWFVLGCLLKIISWPMGFVMMASGAARFFTFTQTAFNILHIAAIWGFLSAFGIEGVAIAFFVLYVFHVFLVYGIAWHLIDFRWSAHSMKFILVSILSVGVVYSSAFILVGGMRLLFGGTVTVIVGFYCMRGLVTRLGTKHRISLILRSIPVLGVLLR